MRCPAPKSERERENQRVYEERERRQYANEEEGSRIEIKSSPNLRRP